MRAIGSSLLRALAGITLAAAAVACAMALWYAPIDNEMGIVQKLIYLHLPAALAAFAGSLGVFIAGVAYLWSRDERWDTSAHCAALVVVVSSAVVLITGMIWGQSFWGYWWTWSPRLTFTLVMLVLYLGYLIMRALIKQEPKRSVASAVYGLIAFLDVPLLYMSARLLPDVHPTSIPLNVPMKITLLICLLPTGLLLLWLILRPWRGESVRRNRGAIAKHGFHSEGPKVA